jgi:hypothetical protein
MEHPAWCSPEHCTITTPDARVHRSQPRQARSPRTDLTVTAQLLQNRPIDGYPDSDTPLVSVTMHFPDYGPDHPAEEYPFCFDGELAQAVGRMLLNTGRLAALPSVVQSG